MPLRFGDFTLDEARRQLWKGGTEVHVSPKSFQLLTILANERPRAVSKQDLHERLWPNTFVTEGNLASLVAELRSALEDDSRNARYVRTHYGFGYSFAGTADDTAAAKPNRRTWIYAGAAAVGLILAIGAALILRNPQAQPAQSGKIRSMAVLPFDTSAADRSDQYLGISLADLVITRLSNLHDLVVRPTSAIRSYAGRRVDSRDAARALQVDAVLEGSIRTTPERIRVTVQLLNAHNEKPVWAGEFDQKRSDMFLIEDSLSERVADALAMRLTSTERTRLAKRYTANPEAYQLYIQARYEADQKIRSDRLDTRSTIDLLKEATAKDPDYALAWAALAETYAAAGAFNQIAPKEAFANARDALQRAIQLDDELPEAHCAAGVIKMYWDLDYAGAEREFKTALQLNPRYTRAMMHYGRLIQSLGRFDEAIEMRKREIEVDPLNPGVQSFLAAAYVTAGKDDLGIEQCKLVLRMDPGFALAHTLLARLYAVRGDHEQAIAEAREAVRTEREGVQALAMLGYTLAIAGQKTEAEEILRRIEAEPKAQPFDIAIVHLGLGHRDDFFRVLENAVDDRTYGLRLKTEPIFAPYRSEPRFQALLRRARFTG